MAQEKAAENRAISGKARNKTPYFSHTATQNTNASFLHTSTGTAEQATPQHQKWKLN